MYLGRTREGPWQPKVGSLIYNQPFPLLKRGSTIPKIGLLKTLRKLVFAETKREKEESIVKNFWNGKGLIMTSSASIRKKQRYLCQPV